MKTLLYAAFLAAEVLALSAGAAVGQATFQAPMVVPATKSELAMRSPLNALVIAGSRMVVAGQRGHILHSEDGKTWVQAAVPMSADLTALSFPTAQQGWAVGHEGAVLHSADGGLTWERQLDGRQIGTLLAKDGQAPDAGADKSLLGVWFEDEKKGFAIGAFNLILHTEDGGRSWRSWADHVDNPKGMHMYAMHPAGGTVYIVGEQGLVLKLDAQKQRFSSVALPYQGTIFGVVGTPKTTLVFGLRGNAYRSTDGGTSWSKVDTGINASLTSGTVRSDGSFVLVSQAGHVLLSTDDGATFERVKTVKSAPAFAVAELANGAVAVAGVGVRIENLKKSAGQ